MSVSLIAFIVSGIGIVLLVGLKLLQEWLGLLLFWPDVREKVEVAMQKHAEKVKYVVRTFDRQTLYIILHFILVKLRALFVYLEQLVDKRLIHLVNLIKGKRMTEFKGNASHFLHDINRFKNKFRRQ